jgi:hypothetical protein
MQVELSIIKHLLSHDNFVKYSPFLKTKDFPDELGILFTCICSHFAVSEESLAVPDLANLVFSNSPKDSTYYATLFDNLEVYQPIESTVVKLIESLKRRNVLQKVSLAAYEEAEGKQAEGYTESLLATISQQPDDFSLQPVTDDLESLLNATYKTPGLRWRLTCLNTSIGSLRKGDFGFVFARPETGKTTFLTSEVSNFISQTTGDILWIVNEEQPEKVMLRVIQAYFGITLETLYGNIQHYRKLFKEQTGGRFKLYDSSASNKNAVESLCKKHLPALIVFDQIDKIQGFKADREDLLLGAIYQWARELAKRFAPVIGVTQADGSGEGVRWLTMANVANAKTAKQAEADWILGIGAIPDSGWESVRFFNISKNKLLGDTDSKPELRHGKLTAIIEPQQARYRDV